MRIPPVRPALLLLFLSIVLFPVSSPAFDGDWDVDTLGTDADWWTGFIPSGFYGDCGNGLDDDITGVVAYGDLLIVAGRFAWANGIQARGLVSWDGMSWKSLDPPAELGGPACFAVHGGKLVVGGTNPTIWTWDGDLWEEIGEGAVPVSFTVCEMETLGGDLWALAADLPITAGSATTELLRWDGSSWDSVFHDTMIVGTWPLKRSFGRLLNHENTLYLCGLLSLAPDGPHSILRWTPSGWEGLGGIEGYGVYTMESFGTDLVVGGKYSRMGEEDEESIAAWNGESWRHLGEGLTYRGYPAAVRSLVEFGGNLYACGSFDSSGSTTTIMTARWDGERWSGTGDFVRGDLDRSRAEILAAWRGEIVLGGSFLSGERSRRGEVLVLNGTRWSPVDNRPMEVASPVHAFLVTDEGLYAAAEFFDQGTWRSAWGVGLWNGIEWHRIGGRYSYSLSFEGIHALATHDGSLVAAGSFLQAGDDSVRNIARWDGERWRPLGGGLSWTVWTLGTWRDRLIAGGWFSRAEDKEVWYIASWNGEEWERMGHGMHGLNGAFPYDLETYDGDLYACGDFSIAGTDRADGMARWNGEEWFGIRGGNVTYDEYYPDMEEMTLWNGMIAVAGEFETAGGQPSPHLAFWDGVDWSPLPMPEEGRVTTLGTHRGLLTAGGRFSFFGDGGRRWDRNIVYQWDGSRWWSLGSGIGYGDELPTIPISLTALASWNGSLYIGGSFTAAGGRPAYGIARWDGASYALPEPSLHLALGPNPALSRVTLKWFQDDPGPVDIRVFDIRGRRTASLVTETWPGGYHAYEWGLKGDDGREVAPGVYFVRLETERGSAVRRVVVVR
ncbi:MAG: T9SS type A sorting domain-containing protein [Candidatus Eisenbacteria bacterium]